MWEELAGKVADTAINSLSTNTRLSEKKRSIYRTEQNRTELYYHKQKYLWQPARIANMSIYAGCP